MLIRSLPSKSFQVLEDGEVCVHPSFDTVLCAALLSLAQTARRNLSSDAFLPTDIGEMVNRCPDTELVKNVQRAKYDSGCMFATLSQCEQGR